MNKEIKEEFKITDTFKWILGIAFFCGSAWVLAKEIPGMKTEIVENKVCIAEIKANITAFDKRQERIENKIDRLLEHRIR